MPETRARHLAGVARRGLEAFRRALGSPGFRKPAWALPDVARRVVPAFLAGSWDDASEGDRGALADLALRSHVVLRDGFVSLSEDEDPPVRREGDAWFLVSREDAWNLLSAYLTADDFERLERVALEVLGSPDPRFELPRGERWWVGIRGHVAPHSGLLRRGLAGTLSFVGSRGEGIVSGGLSASDCVARTVRALFGRADGNWKLWASLSDCLPFLAEAAPDAFFDAVEAATRGSPPVLRRLFEEEDESIFGSSPHVGLLWALETLAWSREHLGRAARLLGTLARLDPGGKLVNRPRESLRSIFLPWNPQTSAALAERLRVLDAMRRAEPEVSWRLMRDLLPESLGVGRFTSKPRWREWAPESPPPITGREHLDGVREVVARMIDDACVDVSRWADLVEALHVLRGEQYEAVLGRLEAMDAERLSDSERGPIWHALRRVVSRHRRLARAAWALPPDQLDRIEGIRPRFEPWTPCERYGWLFGAHLALPEGREGDLEAYGEAVAKARLVAVRDVHARGGSGALAELAGRVERPFELGLAAGRSELLGKDEDELLNEHLASDDAARAEFARGFVAGRVGIRDRAWGEAKIEGIASAWSPVQEAELLRWLPCDAPTWDLAERRGPETEERYWRLIPPYEVREPALVERAARKLLDHGRPLAAVDLLASRVGREGGLPPVLVADVLERALRTSPADERPMHTLAYDVAELMEILEASPEVSEERLARIEWGFLPLLGSYEKVPKRLHALLARDPAFFGDVVALVYRAEGEEPAPASEEERTRARLGDELLRSWRTLPGTSETGILEGSALREWVRKAREELAARGRRAVGDEKIGELLSAALVGADGAWPHEAVREVIDQVESGDLARGFRIGTLNARGVVRKSIGEGGEQERRLAERYGRFADATSGGWPRISGILRRFAEHYRVEAGREDERATLREDLDV